MFSLSRYRKQIMSVLMALVMAGSICFFEPMTVNAVGQSSSLTFNVNYPEPTTGEHNGYFCVVTRDSVSGTYYLNTFFWFMQPYSNSTTSNSSSTHLEYKSVMNVKVNSSNVTFTPDVSGTTLFDWSFCELGSSDNLYVYKRGYYSVGATNSSYSYTYSNRNIVAFMFSGNVGDVLNHVGSSVPTPVIHWSNSVDANLLYDNFYETIAAIDELNEDVVAVLNDVLISNRSIEQKLDILISLHETSNNWLEKIWNSIQEFFSPSTEDQEVTDSLKENSQSQSNQLNDLNEQSKVEKVDPDSASASVDSYIDTAAVGTYGTVLSTFTGNNTVLQYLLIVFAVAFIGYVLFGKR